jgi:hypothetical protein
LLGLYTGPRALQWPKTWSKAATCFSMLVFIKLDFSL